MNQHLQGQARPHLQHRQYYRTAALARQREEKPPVCLMNFRQDSKVMFSQASSTAFKRCYCSVCFHKEDQLEQISSQTNIILDLLLTSIRMVKTELSVLTLWWFLNASAFCMSAGCQIVSSLKIKKGLQCVKENNNVSSFDQWSMLLVCPILLHKQLRKITLDCKSIILVKL